MALSSRCVSGAGLRAACRTPACRVVPARASRRCVQVKALFGGGGGGGGNPFDMKNLMESVKKAQTMVQAETARVQAELAATEFEGYDEEETVRVVMTGNQEPKSVDVTQVAIDAGAEELSARLTAAMKDAHGKSVGGMKEKMKELAKNLGIPNPGAMGLPGGM
ncbi:hypothetical protein FOA52_004912 [Chlamydomonas sp. UWO 241]|nr:hypothetical protein FOA52_004912 [Chlamydomonas sp. UWO 241]